MFAGLNSMTAHLKKKSKDLYGFIFTFSDWINHHKHENRQAMGNFIGF